MEFAAITGLSTRQIRNLEKAGMPCRDGEGNRKAYPLPDALQWYVAEKMREAERSAKPSGLEEAKVRKMEAEAELKQRDLLRSRGELVPLEWMESEFAAALATLRAAIQTVPVRHGRTVSPDDPDAGTAALEGVTDELLDELSHAFDRDDGRDAAA